MNLTLSMFIGDKGKDNLFVSELRNFFRNSNFLRNYCLRSNCGNFWRYYYLGNNSILSRNTYRIIIWTVRGVLHKNSLRSVNQLFF